MKRVVADTNVLVSALQFGGKPKQLLDLAADGQVDLAVSEAIIAETVRVLRDKFDRASEWLAEAEQQLRVIARLVEATEHLLVIETDPTDDRILECAVAAAAEVLVSGDTHLLSLGSFRGIQIQRAHVARTRGPLISCARKARSTPDQRRREEVWPTVYATSLRTCLASTSLMSV